MSECPKSQPEGARVSIDSSYRVAVYPAAVEAVDPVDPVKEAEADRAYPERYLVLSIDPIHRSNTSISSSSTTSLISSSIFYNSGSFNSTSNRRSKS